MEKAAAEDTFDSMNASYKYDPGLQGEPKGNGEAEEDNPETEMSGSDAIVAIAEGPSGID